MVLVFLTTVPVCTVSVYSITFSATSHGYKVPMDPLRALLFCMINPERTFIGPFKGFT